MKTIVTFKALVDTRARNEDGVKITVKKGKTFKTKDSYAKEYRKYKRLFEEIAIEHKEPRKDINTPKNSDAFPVTISPNMTNADIEKHLVQIGAKFKKKGSRKELIKAYEQRKADIEEEKKKQKEEKATDSFLKMIDNRTIEQLKDLVNDLEKAVEIKGINKEVCKEYILDTYKEKKKENEDKKEEDDDGNSEGALDEVSEGSLEGADAGEGKKEEKKKK